MTKEEIHNICSKYNIENYTINDDFSIDVNGSVTLRKLELKELPLTFRNVTGYFDCSNNNLTTLEGVPSYVGGSFYCNNNSLTTLEGVPSSVGGFYDFSRNKLTSLKGLPLNLSDWQLYLQDNFTYSDYLIYCRDIKFKKILEK